MKYLPPILVPSSAKRIATQMLVIENLNGRKDSILRGFVCDTILLLIMNIFQICSNCSLSTGKSFPVSC